MKLNKIFSMIIMLALFTGTAAKAQSTYPRPQDNIMQMLNLSSSYYGTVNSNTVNTQKDTAKGTTIYLNTCKWTSTSVPKGYAYTGPIVNSGIQGYQSAAIEVSTWKTNALTPTITVTPQQSANGVTWATVPGVTVATLSPTSTTVPTTVAFNFTELFSLNYRVQIAATDTGSVQAFIYTKHK